MKKHPSHAIRVFCLKCKVYHFTSALKILEFWILIWWRNLYDFSIILKTNIVLHDAVLIILFQLWLPSSHYVPCTSLIPNFIELPESTKLSQAFLSSYMLFPLPYPPLRPSPTTWTSFHLSKLSLYHFLLVPIPDLPTAWKKAIFVLCLSPKYCGLLKYRLPILYTFVSLEPSSVLLIEQINKRMKPWYGLCSVTLEASEVRDS